MNLKIHTIDEIQQAVREHSRLWLRGGGSKSALSAPPNGETVLDMSLLSGMIEYQPEEYTFTALAGTPVAEVEDALAGNGQYLPFDPPLSANGATLGGTVAAGLSGPGRYRFGGVRDFLLGVKFVDGEGRLVRSGGKVVKNAAGFDLAKCMVGSLGSYGALVELSFKVFPRPESTATVEKSFPSLEQALETLVRVSILPFDLFALDLAPHDEGYRLLARMAGPPETIPARLERLREYIGGGEVIEEDEAGFWEGARNFDWLPTGSALVKIPLTPKRVPALEEELCREDAVRRYSVGANLAWVAWDDDIALLDIVLKNLDLPGLVILGTSEDIHLGTWRGERFARRVKTALDPLNRWVEV